MSSKERPTKKKKKLRILEVQSFYTDCQTKAPLQIVEIWEIVEKVQFGQTKNYKMEKVVAGWHGLVF